MPIQRRQFSAALAATATSGLLALPTSARAQFRVEIAGVGASQLPIAIAGWREQSPTSADRAFFSITVDDDAAMAQVIRTVMPEFGASGPGFAIHDPEVDGMCAAYDRPGAAYFVVELDGRVQGGGGVAPLEGGPEGVCELRKMYFLPALRGQGAGVDAFGRGQAAGVGDAQGQAQAVGEQPGAASVPRPGNPGVRVPQQDAALVQAPGQGLGVRHPGRRVDFAAGAVLGDEAAEPGAQAVFVQRLQVGQRGAQAPEGGVVDFPGVARRRQVRVGVA